MILHLPSPAHDIAAGIIEDTVETAARQLQLLQNVYPLARHLGVAHQKQCRRKGSQTRTHQVSRFVLYVLRFLRPCECLVISIAVIHNFACFNNSVNKLVPFIRCTLPETEVRSPHVPTGGTDGCNPIQPYPLQNSSHSLPAAPLSATFRKNEATDTAPIASGPAMVSSFHHTTSRAASGGPASTYIIN